MPRVDIGDPEFRGQIYSKYEAAIIAMQELVDLASSVSMGVTVADRVQRVSGWLVCIISNSVGAVVTLALNGYGNDAMKVARGIFEGAVTVSFLSLHPEAVDDFLDFHWVHQARNLEKVRIHFPEQYERIPLENRKQIKAEYIRIAKTGRFRTKKGEDRHRWNAIPLSRMAQEVGSGGLYLTFYSWASSMQHHDFASFSMQSAPGVGGFFCDVAPSERWVEEALVISHGSVLKALNDYNRLATLAIDSELETAEQRFLVSWKKRQ